MVRKIFDFFIFSSLYIAVGAVLMVMQTNQLFHLPTDRDYLFFVFFSTMCSYNLHWYLSAFHVSESLRVKWTQEHKTLHIFFFLAGMIGSIYFFIPLMNYFLWIGLGGVLTFLYTAPKINMKPFTYLKKIAIAKTIYLSAVWMYATTIIPFAISGKPWSTGFILFAISRFFFIYAICIIFDYRDREEDKKNNIRSLITFLNEKGINNLFFLSLLIFAACTFALKVYGIDWIIIVLLLLPGAVTDVLYSYSKKNFSDYHYYFLLDGLMMLPSILTLLFFSFF